MTKRFKVVANSPKLDAEINCNDYAYDARHYFDEFVKNGTYNKVYIINNFTGELYDTYDRTIEGGGIKTELWTKIK